MKVLLIDFYDSFTFNIYHYLISLGVDVTVWEDNQVNLEEIEAFDFIVLSPGPGLPSDKKSLIPVLEKYASSKKILGVCLGMQGIAEYYNSELYNLKSVKHGIGENIKILKPNSLFCDLPENIQVGLYHSWAVNMDNCKDLIITAISENNVIMAFEHKELPIYGVQFHPESILTPNGKEILKNFLFKC